VHLNDNRAARASRQDRHEHLGEGRIGGRGLGHVVRHPRVSGVPMLLETPGMDAGWDAVDMARVRAFLAAGPAIGGIRETSDLVPATSGAGAPAHMLGSAPEHA